MKKNKLTKYRSDGSFGINPYSGLFFETIVLIGAIVIVVLLSFLAWRR